MAVKNFLKILYSFFIIPKKFLTEIFVLTIGITVFFAYIVLLTVLSPIFIYRYVLSKVTPCINPSLGKMVTARGHFFAVEQFTSFKTSPRSNVVAALALESHISLESFREEISTKVIEARDTTKGNVGPLKYPEFKQFVIDYMGFKYWKPDQEFRIDNHVKLYDYGNACKPSENNSEFTFNQLNDLMELLVNQPFQPNRSPWEVLIVYNYVNPEVSQVKMTLMIFKFHHCLSDGFGATFSFIGSLTQQIPKVPPPKYAKRGILRQIMFLITFPLRFLHEISNFIVMSFHSHPWKVQDHKKKWKQLYKKTPKISIIRLKQIKNHFEVRFTSVIHACVASAMQKCLIHKYGEDKFKNFDVIPSFVVLPLPDHPHKLRNHATGVFINLPTRNIDEIKRLRRCEADFVLAKKSTMPFVGKYIPIIGGSLVTPLVRVIAKNRSFPVNLSNFPFGDSQFVICGKKAVQIDVAAGGGQGVIGLSFIIYSYVDSIQISITAEKSVFSQDDLKVLSDAILDEVDLLHRQSIV